QMPMHEPPWAVDVAELPVQGLVEPQAQRVDGPEEGLDVRSADGGDEPAHFRDGQDIGEGPGLRDAEFLEGLPVARYGVGVEERDARGVALERAGRELAVVLEVEQIRADLVLGEAIGSRVEVCGQFADGAEVEFLSALSQAGQLEVLVHSLAPQGG